MKITFYGVRGSIPTSGKETLNYGGHTPCVLLEADHKILIFDAGTGIHQLGKKLIKDNQDIYLFLSHYHWDHIQGFPFFKPAYQRGRNIHLLSAHLQEDARAILYQMSDPHFPIYSDQMQANINLMPMSETGSLVMGNINITSCALNHPGGGAAYRIDTPEGSFAYVTDNELSPPKDIRTSWEDWVIFLQNVDLLVHDATYIDDEALRIQGWGHSLVSQTLQLAIDADVNHLVLFHHDPDRTDQQLDIIIKRLKQQVKALNKSLQITLAKEGDTYQISSSDIQISFTS